MVSLGQWRVAACISFVVFANVPSFGLGQLAQQPVGARVERISGERRFHLFTQLVQALRRYAALPGCFSLVFVREVQFPVGEGHERRGVTRAQKQRFFGFRDVQIGDQAPRQYQP